MQVGELAVGIDLGVAAATEPVRQLGRCRHGRRASMARHHDGSAGVGQFGRFSKVLTPQKTGHQTGRKGVARAQHIHHFNAFALYCERIAYARRNLTRNEAAACRAQLDHQGCITDGPNGPQAGQQVARHATGDHELFFRADQQVKLRQHDLQLRSDFGIGHKAVGAFAALGQAPQHRAVVDVEHAQHAMFACVAQRCRGCRAHTRCAQMRAGDQQRAASGDESFVDALRIQRHVGAVLAVKQQGKGVSVLQSQQHQARQALRIELNLRGVTTLPLQGVDEKAAHLLITHARDHGRTQTQARHAKSDVG